MQPKIKRLKVTILTCVKNIIDTWHFYLLLYQSTDKICITETWVTSYSCKRSRRRRKRRCGRERPAREKGRVSWWRGESRWNSDDGREERVRKTGEGHGERRWNEEKKTGERGKINEALANAAPAAGPSRMTIISGHWVHGAWRLSFAPDSYACPSCLSKPSLF